jgi:hypothetical protein
VLVVKKPLAILFNLSLLSVGFFRACGRSRTLSLCSRVVTRKISVIPNLFEKLVCDVITPIIRPLISDEQYGFVDGRSTVTSLVTCGIL